VLAVASKIENRVRGEDRIAVVQGADRLLLVVADGAGGAGAGARAAQLVCDAVVAEPAGQRAWADVLREIDSALFRSGSGGLSTGVVAEIIGSDIVGASVGDSAALLIGDALVEDLTEHQHRKPLLGTGGSEPVPFGPVPLTGHLLVASDGLMKYARRSEIQRLGMRRPLTASADALLDAVRLRTGNLQDDVAIILVAEMATTNG
jgi:serine/threonine protein phosphatase PrpC